jgi:uncharacterized membrane protein YgcG
MGTAGRPAPLRRAGLLLGLLGLELGAVVGLHWLGRFSALRVLWERPLPWLLTSPIQDVLGAVLRMVGLVMAYWLLATTLLYLLASLTRVPAAVRAVRWATLPFVRRAADHAVAVTLATSMVGGGTLGLAAPAGATPAAAPVASSQATSTTSGQEPSKPSQPRYVPDPAGRAPSLAEGQGTSSTARSRAAAQPTTTTTGPTTTDTLRDPGYRFAPPTTNPKPKREASGAGPSNQSGGSADSKSGSGNESSPGSGNQAGPGNESGGQKSQGGTEQQEPHVVEPGDNLWSIARTHLAEANGGSADKLSNKAIAAYWVRVIETNQDRLRSRDPDLIYPGEKIELPPL